MRIWKRGIIGVASAAVIATGAIAAFAANGTQPSPQRTKSVDVKGPCDEAEHANEPRCDGAQVPEDRPGARVNDDGPNHDANDDHGGVSGADDDGPNHDANDDHGGENSGPSDNSGPGSGGEDHTGSDDNSGPGSSSSGPGSSGGDD
jgi:hypothetical protein